MEPGQEHGTGEKSTKNEKNFKEDVKIRNQLVRSFSIAFKNFRSSFQLL